MAYEILNHDQVTPHRLHALVRLVPRIRPAKKKFLIEFLQPTKLVSSQLSAENVYRAAVNCGLIVERSNEVVELSVDPEEVETITAFRVQMQTRLLNVTDESKPNFLLNLFAAWYAVQDAEILTIASAEIPSRFNNEVFGDQEERAFNTTKLRGWEQWAAFLGWGFFLKIGNRRPSLAPDASGRLEPLLAKLLPQEEQTVPFGDFAERLASHCPELDGGVLFNRCWSASRQDALRSHRLSLTLSTALQTLHNHRIIELSRRADTAMLWHLHPAEGNELTQITHIRRRST